MVNQNRPLAAIIVFSLLALVYLFTASGDIHITDTYFSIQTAKSIVENGSLASQNCLSGHCFKSAKDNQYYSRSGLGQAFIFVPYVLTAKLLSLLSGIDENRLINFLISFYNIFFGAGACVVMFYLVKFFKNSNRVAVAISLTLGLATFCWRYSIWDFSEATQMFLLLSTIYLTLKNTSKSLILAGIIFSALILVKILYLVLLPVFIIYIFKSTAKEEKPHGKAGIFLSIVLLGFCFILFLNQLRFGQIFEFGYGLEAQKFYLGGLFEHAGKLLYWLDKGMLIYNPILILGILGYYKFFKLFPKEALFLFSIVLLNFLLTSMWYGWHGNWSWGPRYLVPATALWLLPVFVFFQKKGLVRFILVSFISISLLVQLLSVLTGNLEYLAIVNANGREGMRKGMPAQIIGSAILLKHKITKRNNEYNLSEFGIDSSTKVNTSIFGFKKPFDLWYL